MNAICNACNWARSKHGKHEPINDKITIIIFFEQQHTSKIHLHEAKPPSQICKV